VKENNEINEKLVSIKNEKTHIREEMEVENMKLKVEMQKLKARCRKIEDENRRKNLVVSGVEITPNQSEVQNFKQAGLHLGLTNEFLNNLKIDEIIRMKQKSDKPGDVIIKFCQTVDKMSVLKAARNTKSKEIYVREDFSYATRNIRKNLVNPMLNARKMDFKAFLMFDKLVVEKNGKRNVYTYEPSEEGLKIVQTKFKLDPSKLLNIEADNEVDADIEDDNE